VDSCLNAANLRLVLHSRTPSHNLDAPAVLLFPTTMCAGKYLRADTEVSARATTGLFFNAVQKRLIFSNESS